MYMDDIGLTSNDAKEISHVTKLLDKHFRIKNVRDVQEFT